MTFMTIADLRQKARTESSLTCEEAFVGKETHRSTSGQRWRLPVGLAHDIPAALVGVAARLAAAAAHTTAST